MDDKNQKEMVNGYEIQRAVMFEDNRGFALAANPNAPDPFVTWQFTENENGARDYYWGRYVSNKDTATRDYENRVADYHHSNGVSEKDAYKYYSTQRPVDLGTFPKTESGPVRLENFDKRESVEQGQFKAWGYLVYDAPLSAKQVDDYELRSAPGNAAFIKRIEDMTQIVGIWEDRQKTPEATRFTWYQPSIHAFALREPAVPLAQLEQRYHRAISDITRETEKPTAPKRIAEQLAEAAKMIERGEAPATDKKHNRDER